MPSAILSTSSFVGHIWSKSGIRMSDISYMVVQLKWLRISDQSCSVLQRLGNADARMLGGSAQADGSSPLVAFSKKRLSQ
jgi:hypothetical protein